MLRVSCDAGRYPPRRLLSGEMSQVRAETNLLWVCERVRNRTCPAIYWSMIPQVLKALSLVFTASQRASLAFYHLSYGIFQPNHCPVCDKEKKYVIVEYETPLKAIDDIWLQGVPAKTRMTCYKCKRPVFLVLPEGSVKCPRCKKGKFESFGVKETVSPDSPVPAPKGPLQVRQDNKRIPVPKPTVIIDSAEHMGYTFGRFTNWFSGTVRKRLPIGDYSLLGMEKE
jgi:hypothetical protein